MTELTKRNSDQKRWVVIYPAYINSKKTVEEGRRIGKALACENPTCIEIHDVLLALGLDPVLEKTKFYPRENDREPDTQGRVRVQLKNDDGSPRHPNYPTRASLFKLVAEKIPQLKTRQPGGAASSSTAASGAGGKKNKKKK